MIQTQESTVTVHITFETPERRNLSLPPARHERTLDAVPCAQAQQMADDYATYCGAEGETEQRKLYRYEQDGEEVLVALDFGEVQAITTLQEARRRAA
jgi:hypothetical protein